METAEAFRYLEEAAELTESVYWHLQGEPLLHPEFRKITEYAGTLGLTLKLTTNASHLKELEDHLLSGLFHQINFSLQSLNEVSPEERERVRNDIADFTEKALEQCPELYLNYRWWQDVPPDLDFFAERFQIPQERWIPVKGRKNRRIIGRLYSHFDGQFSWPEEQLPERRGGSCGSCYGLIDHCGILCDGRVVPCCLDSHGGLVLGDLHENSLKEILESPLAKKIEEGFRRNQRIMKQCRSCGYAARFDC
jgi:radical SAM protein with 4Fe4S-binding SPASM domain